MYSSTEKYRSTSPLCTMRPLNTVMRYYLFISALLPVALMCSPQPQPAPVCKTDACKKRSEWYINHMESRQDPCDDFYEYVCGTWRSLHPRPPYELEWSVRDLMKRQTLYQLQLFLQTPEASEDTVDVRRAKKVFQVCMNIPSLGKGDDDFLMTNMGNVGRYPETSIWDIHKEYLKLTGESPLFDIQIMAHHKHNDEPLLQFKDIQSPFGSLVLLGTWNYKQKKNYRTFLISVMNNLQNPNVPAIEEKVLTNIVEKVISFRFKLNEISRASLTEQSDPLQPMTVNELQEWYNLNTKQTKTTQINWAAIVSSLYSRQSDAALVANPTVGIRRKAYFIALADLLADTTEATLVNHFKIYFAERHMTLTNSILTSLDELVSNIYGFTAYIRKAEMNKSFSCAEDINMDETVGKLYAAHYFQETNIPIVKGILGELKNTIKKNINESDRLDLASKLLSMHRIDHMKWWVGYPPWYNDANQTAEPTTMKPATINANLNIQKNQLYVNAALMQSPFVSADLPAVINYGAIGTTLAHEIFRVLDACPKFKNEKGEIISWCKIWSDCFAKLYVDLEKAELESLHLSYATMEVLPPTSNHYTSTQHLADVLGLQAAYDTYQAKLRKTNSACGVIPYFESFTCDHMFFISYANTMCGSQIPEVAYSKKRTHTSFRLRVNAAVSYSNNFNRAFGCATKYAKNLPQNCHPWIYGSFLQPRLG